MRLQRVNQLIREEISHLIQRELKDPRLGFVTVTEVDVAKDLRTAKVYVSVLGSESQRASTFEGLNGVAAHLRGRIGRALRLRAAPEIEFRNDESIAHAAHIEQLLAQVRRDLPDQAADTPAPTKDEGRDD